MGRKCRKQGSQNVYKICKKCKREFILGHNGTVNGCDECLGITRDKQGYAWMPEETEMLLQDIGTGEEEILTREEAFCEV